MKDVHIKMGSIRISQYALILFATVAQTEPVPGFRPPNQAYIYDFSASVFAPVPATPALNLGASFSIEFWMMLDRDARDSQYMRVFQKGIPNSGDPFTGYELDLDPGTHQLSYAQSTGSPGSYRGARVGVSLEPGQWYHVAIISDNLQITLYLNGQQQTRFTAAGPPPANSFPLVLAGQAYGDGTAYCCGFPGSLRQFRIWNRAIQSAEITTVATKLLSGNEAGLVADWPLDDGQGETLHDIGPNHLALQLSQFQPGYLSPGWLRTAVVDGGPYFQLQTLKDAVPGYPRTIPIDFDSDGKVDLLVCQSTSGDVKAPCAAFRNDGKGVFSDVTLRVLGPNPPAFEVPRDFCVADFNGDGRADVFIASNVDNGRSFAGSQSRLLLQTVDGRLQDVTATHLPQKLAFTHNVACGDIDGNGSMDIFLVNLVSLGLGGPEIYLNDGQGHFTVGEPGRLPAILQKNDFAALSARFIDLNKDGRLHLYLGLADQLNRPYDLLLLNDGKGFFTAAPDGALPVKYGGRNWGTVSVRVADIDGDGWPDLIVTVFAEHYAEGAVQVLLNNHDGTLRDATDRILQPPHARYGSLWSDNLAYVDPSFPVDFNGDGFMDLLVEGQAEPSRLYLNTGPSLGGRLVEVTDLLPKMLTDVQWGLAEADFNGDGSPDIVGFTRAPGESNFTLESWVSTRRFTLTPDLIPDMPTGPFFLRGNVLNAASFSADALAPGELVTIFGRNLGPGAMALASPAGGAYPTQLAGTRVLVNNVAAPIIYTSAGALTAIVPFRVLPQTRADVVVEYQGTRSPPVSIFVANGAPGFFTLDSSGSGPAAILNVDSATGAVSVNSRQNPASRGGIITAYFTGAGQTDPPSTDGVVATDVGRLAQRLEAGLDFFGASNGRIGNGQDATRCEVNPGCQPVEVLYAGPAPGIVAGVIQVNMRLPNSQSASGTHSLGISVGGVWSQLNATVSIR